MRKERNGQTRLKLLKRKPSAVISTIIIAVVMAGFLVFGIFAKNIFGEENAFSSLFKDNLGKIVDIFNKDTLDALISSLVYVVIMSAVYKVIKWLLRLSLSRTKRGKTIVNLLASFIKYAVAIVTAGLVLAAFGVDTVTLLASAGILAFVIGLGAQSLIEDIIAGLFIVFEGEYQVGDIVTIEDFRGAVVNVGIRTTTLQDDLGNVKIISNSAIKGIINMSLNLSVVLCRVRIGYGENLERTEKIISEKLPAIKGRVQGLEEGPFYRGVSELGDKGVTLLFIAKCKEEDRFQVERGLNREIKMLFDAHGIVIPYPNFVIKEEKEKGNKT